METPAHSELAQTLTRYYFGDNVAAVIKSLFSYDRMSLKLMRATQPNIKLEDLKRGLLVLIKYQLVDYVKNQSYEYYVVPHRVFQFFRIPRFINSIRVKEGELYALALSTLAERGLVGEEVFSRSIETKFRESGNVDINSDKIQRVFDKLLARKYIVRMGSNICLNIESINRGFRDELVSDAVGKFYNNDLRILSLCRTILELSAKNTSEDAAITAPVPFKDISDALCPDIYPEITMLQRCLDKLTSECNFRFFVTSGNHPHRGPMYALNLGLVLNYLMKEHICSVITTRFGPKCCRVFRVLLLRGPLLLKQIEECIMLPARDVREYTYMLIKEGFIRNRQVPKTPDNAPGKSVFIMSVELDRVVYNLADLSCRSISNLLTRHDFELERNATLLKRSQAVQDLLKNEMIEDKSAELEIWNQYFNSHELGQLNQINRTLDKILFAKIQVDESLYIAHNWLQVRPNIELNSPDQLVN